MEGIKIQSKHTKIKNILDFEINKNTFTAFTPSPNGCSESCSGDCSGDHVGDHATTGCEFDGYENVIFTATRTCPLLR